MGIPIPTAALYYPAAKNEVLAYGIEVCSLNKSETDSLQFVASGGFMKIFDIKSNNIVIECLDMFNDLF